MFNRIEIESIGGIESVKNTLAVLVLEYDMWNFVEEVVKKHLGITDREMYDLLQAGRQAEGGKPFPAPRSLTLGQYAVDVTNWFVEVHNSLHSREA